MKKVLSLLAAILLAVSIFVTPVMASEVCDLNDGTECEIWWMYNKEGHWRACVNHRDAAGNDTAVSEVEAHEFVDGVCSVCEGKETKDSVLDQSALVFLIVVGVAFLIPLKSHQSFKKNKFDERPFGLDKFRKF